MISPFEKRIFVRHRSSAHLLMQLYFSYICYIRYVITLARLQVETRAGVTPRRKLPAPSCINVSLIERDNNRRNGRFNNVCRFLYTFIIALLFYATTSKEVFKTSESELYTEEMRC